MKIDENETEQLAAEICLRMDFDHAIEKLTTALTGSPPEDANEALEKWVAMLGRQESVFQCAAVECRGEDLEIIPANGEFAREWGAFGEAFHGKVASAAAGGLPLCCPAGPPDSHGNTPLLLVSPCPKSKPPTAIAVIYHGRGGESFLHSLVNQVAIRAAGDLMAIRVRELERLVGHRQMAVRVAHMCAGSILLAQLRLGRLSTVEKLAAMSPETIGKEIKGALESLNEAQRAMDRARLFASTPWQDFQETFELGPFLAELAGKLNVAGEGKNSRKKAAVVKAASVGACENARAKVTASKLRMDYAFRDLILGAWILGGKQPVSLSLENGRGTRVTIRGAEIKRPLPPLQPGQDLVDMLRDPEMFIETADSSGPERSMGLQNAIHLVQEVGGPGAIAASLTDAALTFTITLPPP